MDVKRQLIFAVINIFLSKSCIVCEDCQCEGLVNILKSTMLMEIFDLKMQNGMLQSRMDKLESMLQGKSSSTPTQDINGLDAFEERLDSVESNMQQAIEISKKALKLNAIISKGLQSEKKERIELVSKSERQIHHLNGSVTDLKFTITNALQDNLTKIGDDIEKMEHLMKDSVMDVKNDVKIFQYNMSELQSQTNALIVYNITDLEFNLAFVSREFRKNIAELDQQMNKRLLDIKHENAEVIRNVTKLQNVTNEIVGKSIANLKSNVVAIDKNVLQMEAAIKSLQDISVPFRKYEEWTLWGSWTSCSVSCGGGIKSKSRTCTNSVPSLAGKHCDGESYLETACSSDPCHCSPLPTINDGTVSTPGTRHGTTATYKCNADHDFTAGDSTRHCIQGTWTGKEPTCTPITNVGCYRAGAAYMYKGTRRTTRGWISCQWWNSQSPHSHGMTDASKYPDWSVAAAQNYCRDPDRTGAPWCYTTNSNKRWDYCGVKMC